jgi:hypothetical protein
VLQADLRRVGKDVALYALGNHGTSPACHVEVIDYAARHLRPQEVIVIIYLGNDLSDMTPETNGQPPARCIYYDFDRDHRLALNPASAAARDSFRSIIEISHRPLLVQAPAILRSHSMIVQSLNSMRDRIATRREQAARMASATGAARDIARLGLNPAPFADPETPLARRCLDLLLAELDLCADTSARNGMAMRLVTIPGFPSDFYRTQRGGEWSAALGGYDYLRPEREIAAFATKRGWPHVALGAQMQRERLDVATIRGFYFHEGTGHFTEAGHRYCADAMRAEFFRD